MYPGCRTPAIRRSHAISRSGPLNLVAESGHVMSPRLHPRTGKILVKRIGIGRASTFSGFCREHELAFGPLEQTKHWNTNEYWSLQFFRTACWELRAIDEGISALKRVEDAYRARISDKATTFLHLGRVRVTTRSIDHQQSVLEDNISALVKYRKRLRRELFGPLMKDVVDGGSRTKGIVVDIPSVVPLCLAGTGAFTWQTLPDQRKTHVLALIQVLPSKTGMRIGMLATAGKYHCLLGYLATSSRQEGGVATMLQTWMLRGTEQWFLSPSVWNALPETVRTAISGDFIGRYDLADSRDHGLFREIRL
jgi:hypothetical protein